MVVAGLGAFMIEMMGLTTGKLVWANQSGARPALPYVAINLVWTDNTGGTEWGEIAEVTEDEVTTVSIAARDFKQGILNVQAFGTGAYNTLESLRKKIKSHAGRDLMQLRGFVLYVENPIQETSAAVTDNKIEERASLDVNVRFGDLWSEEISLIETVNIADTVNTLENEFTVNVV